MTSRPRDALIVERNPIILKRLERYFRCAGYRPHCVQNFEELAGLETGYRVVGADVFDIEWVERALDRAPEARAMLWTAEPMERALRVACKRERISNILGRPNFDSMPRAWELSMVLRRMQTPQEEGPRMAWYMNWGFTGFQDHIDSSATRDKVVHKVERLLLSLSCRKSIVESCTEVAHELLMNAMYDAPLDTEGNPKYAFDRKKDLVLDGHERPEFKLAADGSKVAIQVRDSFGGLKRGRLFEGLARGLAGGEMDTSFGGAGLGMTVIHRRSSALFVDVIAGGRTEVTGLFELDHEKRDAKSAPKSLHYFSR